MSKTKQTWSERANATPTLVAPTEAEYCDEDNDSDRQSRAENSCNDGDDGSETKNTTTRDIKDSFLDPLEVVGDGSFVTTGQWPNINPGLYIEGLGK